MNTQHPPLPFRVALILALGLGLLPKVVFAEPTNLEIQNGQKIALVGNSTAERMNLFGHFETRFQLRFGSRQAKFRNFGWPADEVSVQQRPGNYNKIDDPYLVFSPDLLICFFGFNESFVGDDEKSIAAFQADYAKYLTKQIDQLTRDGVAPRFVLVSPIAFEATGNPLQPDGQQENQRLQSYANAVREFADQQGCIYVDLFTPTHEAFTKQVGAQYTINGVHLNEAGDALVAELLDEALFGSFPATSAGDFERVREVVKEKAWLHQQDYRMLNGWYVYGGRRTWDTKTFPGEFRKIRNMVAVRDQYLWDLTTGREVPDEPDDSQSGEVFIPETMFGTRDDNFRKMREPKTLDYPTPEQSIAQMSIPEGFEVQLFASEEDFPELANPTQIAFDRQGRLWVACMVNYPQWLPGAAKPNDRLLIFEDLDGDGKADQCTTFYDKLICPTGFEFYKDGVLVVDEPRILFIRDTDGDDRGDEVVHMIDGIGTDDTHHAMGAWEYSNGGRLHMLEGIAMSTTLETPWGPRRQHGASGAYVWDLESQRISHFRTPGQYNPWCLVFDSFGNGIIGDGTNANQHWANALSGGEVATRASLDPIFNNEGIRPAAGNELLRSRHFPEDYHNQLIYSCVINMHGMPAFALSDEPEGAGIQGKRVDDLLSSTDMFFRPVDPKIGPDGALWFGDWCNALIGHMQYSQRDPNRDHMHGRIYRMVHTDSKLLKPVSLADASVDELLQQLTVFEPRTRYRVRRELRRRDANVVLPAVSKWAAESREPAVWQEALWVQEHFHQVDVKLVDQVLGCDDARLRAAAVHVLGNEWRYLDSNIPLLQKAIADGHPRVRMEAVRAASLCPTEDSVRVALSAVKAPMDKWISYVLDHALQTLQPIWEGPNEEAFLASLETPSRDYLEDFLASRGPGSNVRKPLKVLVNVDAKKSAQENALLEVVAAKKGDSSKGAVVFKRVCAACHQHGDLGVKFGPELSGLGDRMTKHEIIRSIVWPNDSIAKGYESVMVLDYDGVATKGFVLAEDDETLTLGIADGKRKSIVKDDIEFRKEMKASSMPEGLTETIAPGEFLDLLAFLMGDWIATNPNLDYKLQAHDGWTEVSRQSHLKLGKNFSPGLNVEAQHLLSHEGVRQKTFAFHSAGKPSTDTDVIIRMNQPTELRVVKIFNRREAQFHDRAKGITMSVSDDGENWEKVWHSEEAYPDWYVGFPDGKVVRYVKFGLDRPGIFHLDRVTMYGKVLEETPANESGEKTAAAVD